MTHRHRETPSLSKDAKQFHGRLKVASTHCFPSLKPCDDPVSFANFSLHRHTILTKLSQSVEKTLFFKPISPVKI